MKDDVFVDNLVGVPTFDEKNGIVVNLIENGCSFSNKKNQLEQKTFRVNDIFTKSEFYNSNKISVVNTLFVYKWDLKKTYNPRGIDLYAHMKKFPKEIFDFLDYSKLESSILSDSRFSVDGNNSVDNPVVELSSEYLHRIESIFKNSGAKQLECFFSYDLKKGDVLVRELVLNQFFNGLLEYNQKKGSSLFNSQIFSNADFDVDATQFLKNKKSFESLAHKLREYDFLDVSYNPCFDKKHVKQNIYNRAG